MKKKIKPTHPADVINLADIATATEFTATLFLGSGQFGKAKADNLAAIRAKAAELQKANPKTSAKPIIHAIVNGKALPVPAKYTPPANVIGNAFAGPAPATDSERKTKREATVAAVKAAAIEGAAKAAPKPAPAAKKPVNVPAHLKPDSQLGKAPAAKAVKAKPAAKPAKEPAPKKAKAEKAPRETRTGSKTETVLAMLKKGATRKAIVEKTGWQVDLKQLAARKGLKLKKNAEGVITIA